MEANLTQTRFGLPLIVAVAFHAALLLWIPKSDIGFITPPEPTVILRPLPIEISEVFRVPQESPAQASAKPVGGGHRTSTLDDLPHITVERAVYTIDVERTNPTVENGTHLPNGLPFGPGPGTDVGSREGDPVGIGKLDRTPHATVQPSPLYPAAMRASGTEGRVVIEFTVDTAGNVVSATVHSATNREFEEAAVRAVMRWRFEAGRRNGRAVPFRMAVPLEFRLNDNS